MLRRFFVLSIVGLIGCSSDGPTRSSVSPVDETAPTQIDVGTSTPDTVIPDVGTEPSGTDPATGVGTSVGVPGDGLMDLGLGLPAIPVITDPEMVRQDHLDYLSDNDLVMFDRANDSLYPQIYAASVSGVDRGETLSLLPVVEATWGAWKQLYPNTLVVANGTYSRSRYTLYPYGDYRTNDGSSCSAFVPP